MPRAPGFFFARREANAVRLSHRRLDIYHSLNEPIGKENPRALHMFKWLDYSKLTRVLYPTGDQRVILFTAIAMWSPSKRDKHERYARALRSKSVEIVRGKFKERFRTCSQCHKKFKAHEEKQTDVNIAIKLFELAARDEYDVAVVVSVDTDLVPAVNAVKQTYPTKEVTPSYLLALEVGGRWI